jgi:hypothetical protein
MTKLFRRKCGTQWADDRWTRKACGWRRERGRETLDRLLCVEDQKAKNPGDPGCKKYKKRTVISVGLFTLEDRRTRGNGGNIRTQSSFLFLLPSLLMDFHSIASVQEVEAENDVSLSLCASLQNGQTVPVRYFFLFALVNRGGISLCACMSGAHSLLPPSPLSLGWNSGFMYPQQRRCSFGLLQVDECSHDARMLLLAFCFPS